MMAYVSKGKSLAFVHVGDGGPTSPIEDLGSCTCQDDSEISTWRHGTSMTPSRWRSSTEGHIVVNVADVELREDIKKGAKFTDVILTFEASKDASGEEAVAGEHKVTINRAVVTEIGELTTDPETGTPAVFSVRFDTSDHLDGTQPTYVEEWDAASNGGGGGEGGG